jgi:hypothetical protein
MARGLCRRQPEAMQPDPRTGDLVTPLVLCAACPVIVDCHALAERLRPTSGVWAGQLWGAKGRPLPLRCPGHPDTADHRCTACMLAALAEHRRAG